MKFLVCDIIGCDRPGAWMRIENGTDGAEDFLCEACRAKLNAARPDRAGYYVPFDIDVMRHKIQGEDRAGERGQADLSTCRLPEEVPQVLSSPLRL